ncbi:MAG: ABC transporter permease [Chloroflexi bacterium]|nr:ABC transporter permease [Chloroflexota bacterium]
MKKTLTILRHEFRQTLKRKSFILLTLALPLLLIVGYSIYQGVQHWYHPTAPEEVKTGYVDEVGIFNSYTKQGDTLFVPYSDETAAKSALLAEEIKDYIVIPADYISTGAITRYTMDMEILPSETKQQQIGDFLVSNLLPAGTDPQVMERAMAPATVDSLRLDEHGEVAPARSEVARFVMPLAFGMLFLFSLFFSAGYLFQSVTEEKENRVIEVMLSSVSPQQLLVGKVLGLGAAGLLQVAVWFAAIRIFAQEASGSISVLSDMTVSASLLAWALVYFILGYLLFAALYAGIGSIGSNAREAQGWSTIFVLPAVSPMWFSSYIIGYPDSVLAKVLTFFPLSAPITVMMRLPNGAISAWELGLSIVILAASVAVAMWAAAKTFRVFLLMYGKRPRLKEIIASIREA